MTFKEWWQEHGSLDYDEMCQAHAAWNAAIDAAEIAIESSDHNDDDSGLGANCNAMMAVKKLKAL